MTKEFLKQYFNSDFKGIDSLLNEVLVPIFGDYEEGWTEITEELPSKEAAAKANIKRIKHAASLWAGRRILVFDVTLYDDCHIHASRKQIQTLIRQFVGHFQGALMAFHYENPEGRSWRLSYMEKQETNANSTSAKRYTYLCGRDYPCRTIAERFAILAGQEKTDMNLEAAFSVEALSDEFFTGYRSLYQEFCDYLTANRNDATLFGPEFATCEEKFIRDYVKKMMGRITFLHFLQRKGWLGQPRNIDGWGRGDLNFMSHLFEKATDEQKASFLDEVLEPIFFECLNEKREDDFFDTHVPGIRMVKIPYLNGGLFERDEIDCPRSTFPADYFKKLFGFFGQYNFTIDENDPFDTEVGVDPEMLGKIFENLLEDNKDKGAFYTPKEIVNYMCREALVAYLVDEARRKSEVNKQRQDNFEAAIRRFVDDPELSVRNMKQYDKQQRIDLNDSLSTVKICDPAIGSGAFPMGLLNLLVNCRTALNEALEIDMSRASLKKEIIKNNIYGVDIEKGAIDIARLRFWLSIVVDLDEPEPLPNFDYKFMQGNSLLEQFQGLDLIDILPKSEASDGLLIFGEEMEKQAILKEFMTKYFTIGNHEQKGNLREKINDIVKDLILVRTAGRRDIAESIAPIDISANDQFFLWHTWFAEVFNRPNKQGFDIVIGNPPYGAKLSKEDKAKYRKVYPESQFKIDTYSLFVLLALKLATPTGIFYYIIPNTLLDNYFEEEVRKKLLKRSILEINDLSDKVFSTAVVHSMIFGCSNQEVIDHSVKVNTSSELQRANISIPQSYFAEQPQTSFSIRSYDTDDLSSKLKIESEKLVKVLDIRQAIKTGDDPHYIVSSKIDSNYKPILRGKDVNKYLIKDPHLFVNYGRHLACPRNPEIFEQPKILIREAGATITATLDDENYYIMSSLYNAILIDDSYSMKYLLGLINSRLFQYLMYKLTFEKTKGAFTKAKIFHYYELPVKKASLDQQQPIIDLVDTILSTKRNDPEADTTALETQIDKLVYQLYDLTPEEIQLIEQ